MQTLPDLQNTIDPNQVAKFMRLLAWQYEVSATELQQAWQDQQAGRVWAELAKVLNATADKCEKVTDKFFNNL